MSALTSPAVDVDRKSDSGPGFIEERFVWWLWQTRRFDGAAARDAGFDIIFPGWFSTAAGPDFRDAMIGDASGRLVQGDVEVHVVDSAWRAHGHDSDPAYNKVILHVVVRRDSEAPTLTESGVEVPVLELASLLRHSLGELALAMGDWRPAVVRCPSHKSSAGDLLSAVVDAGRTRFREKVQRMVANVEALGADEALYRDLAESLGYSANREQFRRIAEALPFRLLASLSVFDSEQLLLTAAGLASQGDLLSSFIDGPVVRPGDLSTFRVRPGNSPTVRLRALARLAQTHKSGLAGAMLSAPVDQLWRRFCVGADTVLVGKSRADDIVLNLALPYLTAYHGLDGEVELAKLPAPSGNRWVTSLRSHLVDSGLTIRPFRALHHLGLQELSLRFCRFDHCEACPLHVVVGAT